MTGSNDQRLRLEERQHPRRVSRVDLRRIRERPDTEWALCIHEGADDPSRLRPAQGSSRSFLAIGVFGGTLCLDIEARFRHHDPCIAREVEIPHVVLVESLSGRGAQVARQHNQRSEIADPTRLLHERAHPFGIEPYLGLERDASAAPVGRG